MKQLVLGLVTFGLSLVLGTSVALSAPQEYRPTLAEARAQGMLEAPTVARAAGIACIVTDALLIGSKSQPDSISPNGAKSGGFTYRMYEVDCDRGVGFLLIDHSVIGLNARDCLTANTNAEKPGPWYGATCRLPGNANPMTDLAPLLTKAGVSCTPDAARGIGQNRNNTFLEVSCKGGRGYVLQVDIPTNPDGSALASDCLRYDSSNDPTKLKCTLRDAAYRLSIVDRYVAEAKNGCVVKDRRYIATTTDGSDFFEASCKDGKGYIYRVLKDQLFQISPCEKAVALLGGCTLSGAK